MQRVLVIDRNKQPLMPCYPARARELLKAGRAAVYRRYPYTIMLQGRGDGDVQPVAFKVDPGAKTTGIALVADFQRGKCVVWAAELTHRGNTIRDALSSRQGVRHSRRTRKLRYRPARFMNRRKPEGWLPPSLLSRVHNIMTWSIRLYRFVPLNCISMELVRFDTNAMQNAEISGVEYQQGELMGYEVREYLLEKWGRKCAYCGVKNIPLEVEHIIPKSRGGSNRVSNLTLACRACNLKKGNQTAIEFGHANVYQTAKVPLKDAGGGNATRWALFEALKSTGLPVEVSPGSRTKYNRMKQDYPKTHWLDAACVGRSGASVFVGAKHKPLLIKATGHGSRQICRTDKYGFPLRYRLRKKRHFGFQTGDIVRAVVPSGKYTGKHIGRVVCRASGSFDIRTALGKVVGVHHKYCCVVHHADGYGYMKGEGAISPHS